MRGPRVAAVLLLSSAAPALLSGGSHGAAVPPTRVAPSAPAPVRAEPGCVDCHSEIAREWRASLHRQSWTDAVFQSSYTHEPRQFCRSCHAPLATPGPVPEPAAAAEGIDCTLCHGPAGNVRGGLHGHSDTPAGMTGHPVQRDAGMNSASACASCHQFAFPPDYGRPLHGESGLMQHTLDEWSRSPAAAQGQACQHCHMPSVTSADGRTHRSHLFPGAGDDALLQQAISASVSAVRRGALAELTVTLRAGLVGHSVPTGDLFREVRWALTVPGAEAPASERVLARHFRAVPGRNARGRLVNLRRDADDARLGPATEQRFTVRVRAPTGTALEWTLAHRRMGPAMARQLGVSTEANERVFRRGSLRAP